MKKKYVIALDEGTTNLRAVIFNRNSEIVAMKSKEINQFFPNPGWVEHDAAEIWQSQRSVLVNVVKEAGISPQEVACIGITNQRETVVLWDNTTGNPVYNAIVWQCRRTASICDDLKKNGFNKTVQEKTGLVIDSYFSGSKIKWILENVPGVKEKAKAGKILAGTIDTWLVWNLTKGNTHVTDYSNASRTMLYNIKSLEWDSELLHALDIPEIILPKVVSSSAMISEIDKDILGVAIPICGIAGDQQAALFGQACFEKGMAKNTYGTGCFILMNTGKEPVRSKNNLLTTIAWGIGDDIEYALEGSVFNAGSAIQWLRDGLRIIENASQSDIDAEKVSDSGGIYIVPAFNGLGAPYWDMKARGLIIGITRGTTREHIIRATLESIAYQSKDVFEVMKADSGIELKELKVDGGASVSPFLMQFQSDILGVNVNRSAVVQTTSLGAAYLAGLGIGFWDNKKEIMENWKSHTTYKPHMDENTRQTKHMEWRKAVERSMDW